MANSTAPKPVQPLHGEHIHVEKKKTAWIWLLVPLVALGLLALYLLNNRTPAVVTTTTQTIQTDTTKQIAVTTTQVVPRVITYQGKQWEVKGTAETFLPGEAKFIAKSAQGDDLYYNAKKGYTSGAGSKHVANTISTPSGRIYLKYADGRFHPLFLKP